MTRGPSHRTVKIGVGALVSAAALVLASPAFASHGPDVNGKAKAGLCHAYFRGSNTGKSHKHKHATAFKKLEAAAAAHSETVEAFCADAQPGKSSPAADLQAPPSSVPNHPNVNGPRTPPTSSPNHPNVNGSGTPPTSTGGSGVADGNSHDGASLHGTTNADAASGGHSANGSNNAGAHRP
jgi:hypothetical protein